MEIPYLLLISAIVFSFYSSFMGGANDFANAFGTSVGSKAISIKQAVIIAIFAEFIGAILVGGHVTETISKGIVDPVQIGLEPFDLAVGLLAALIGSGLFLQLATFFGLPVSTTHAIVGAVVGFGMIAGGIDSVNWTKVGFISISWVISPVGGWLAAFITFKIIQNTVLEKSQPLVAANKVIPFFVGVTSGVVALSMVYKGLKNLHLDLSMTTAFPLASLLGLLVGLAVWLYHRKELVTVPRDVQLGIVESRFKYLQIFTAAYVAFAHGANDVANSVGPLAGIWALFKSGIVGAKAETPIWILALGGTGIVLGLAVFGRKVIETIGTKITTITPSRGFSAEFAAATIVLVFSKLSMPVSTTHTVVGAVIGVGFARGIGAIDMTVVRNILMSWVVTIPASTGAAILVYLVLRAIT